LIRNFKLPETNSLLEKRVREIDKFQIFNPPAPFAKGEIEKPCFSNY
jgi:hypothetical protein